MWPFKKRMYVQVQDFKNLVYMYIYSSFIWFRRPSLKIFLNGVQFCNLDIFSLKWLFSTSYLTPFIFLYKSVPEIQVTPILIIFHKFQLISVL